MRYNILFLLTLILFFTSCQKREWNNPFDPACPKEIFTPTDFASKQQDNSINLTWVQAVKNISGFRIERKIEGESAWTEVLSPQKTINTWTDLGITGGKNYEYRILAVAGSNQSNFATSQIKPLLTATLTTAVPSAITASSALLGGTITTDGGATITERGVCWATTANPTISNNKLSIGAGTGAFSNTVSGLIENTIYYIRSYAINSQGTVYGNELNFSSKGIQNIPSYIPNTGLIGWWPFNGNAVDESGNGNNGNVLGSSLTTDRYGNFGNAYSFNGTTNYIDFSAGNTTSINVTGDITICFWLKTSQITSCAIISFGDQISPYNGGYLVGLNEGTNGSVGKLAYSIQGIWHNSTVTLNNNSWHFVSISLNAGTLSLYIDNILNLKSTGVLPTLSWNGLRRIAAANYSNNAFYQGLLDDIGIWNRALTQQEMTNLYNSDGPFQEETVSDIDGNEYHTVTIGSQVWMTENLKTTKYNDGTSIPNVTENLTWTSLSTGAYCWYNNNIVNKATYGALYNWYALNTGKLCPIGWHVPTDIEWTTMINYLGGEYVAGGKLKEKGTIHWISPNIIDMNPINFSSLPGGKRYPDGQFVHLGYYGYLWTSSETDQEHSNSFTLYHASAQIYKESIYYKRTGFSIRCIKD